jgi:hypothetical protein
VTKYLAGVLTVIAAGTMLIAYGLLGGRTATADGAAFIPAADRVQVLDRVAGRVDAVPQRIAYQTDAGVRPVPAVRVTTSRRAAANVSDEQPRPVRSVSRPAGRDWKKTAMIIGGTSAAGAGLGAIFGGGKGALIGAAIGGGASTIYEVTRR